MLLSLSSSDNKVRLTFLRKMYRPAIVNNSEEYFYGACALDTQIDIHDPISDVTSTR